MTPTFRDKLRNASFYIAIISIVTSALLINFLHEKIRIHMSKKHSGTIIILNGVSSAGKSSIIKAFQKQQKDLWISAGIDQLYVGVIPPHFLDGSPEHEHVMTVRSSEDTEHNKVVTAVFGPSGEKIIKGMHQALAAYAHAGNNVIADYIMYDPAWMKDLKKALHDVNVIFVGVTAPLDVIEKREKDRGTSPQGHARSHYHSVHDNVAYDLIIDTSTMTPEQAAEKIGVILKNKN